MKIAGNRKKNFIVLGQFDEKKAVEALAVKAETHEIACHLAEIKNGWGTFIACNESQAIKIAKDIRESIKSRSI